MASWSLFLLLSVAATSILIVASVDQAFTRGSERNFLQNERLGGYLPPGTSASAWTRNVVLTYMDSRSMANSSDYDPQMEWSVDKFKYLAGWRDTHASLTDPPVVDTFFDGFLLIGMKWGAKNFWQGQGLCCTNSSDWMGFLRLQIEMGVASLDSAVGEVRDELGMGTQLAPGVIMMIPYPDTRQEDFGSIEQGGRSLNFSSGVDDRTAAMMWFVDQSLAAWNAAAPRNLRLIGWYHFLESIPTTDDETMLTRVSAHVHSTFRSARFWWIPYFSSQNYDKWKEVGFDAVTLQPNYAFHNSSTDRFPAVANITRNLTMGVEMELPQYTRNPQVKDWQTSFVQYLDAAVEYGFDTMALRTYYLGNAFVNMAQNATTTCFYDKLFWFVKGTYPFATPLPGVDWPQC